MEERLNLDGLTVQQKHNYSLQQSSIDSTGELLIAFIIAKRKCQCYQNPLNARTSQSKILWCVCMRIYACACTENFFLSFCVLFMEVCSSCDLPEVARRII